MGWIKSKLYDFYASEWPGGITAICLPVAGLFGFLYVNSIRSQNPKPLLMWIAVTTWIIPTLLSLGRMLIEIRHKMLRLYLHKDSGYLHDKRLGFRNVSLRTRTVHMVFSKLRELKITADNLQSLGKEIGHDFCSNFSEGLRQKGVDFANLALERKLKLWKQYDSASGMGLFSYSVQSPRPIIVDVKVKNAFTASQEPPTCRFMAGYICGVFSEMFNTPVQCVERSCGGTRGGQCHFAVSE